MMNPLRKCGVRLDCICRFTSSSYGTLATPSKEISESRFVANGL